MPKKTATMQQAQVRMDDDLIRRIEKYRSAIQKQTKMSVSFAAAVRALIERGLAA